VIFLNLTQSYAAPEMNNDKTLCDSAGTFLNLDGFPTSIAILEYTKAPSTNSLIITKSIDESSPLLDELMDREKSVSNGVLFSCVISDRGNLQNHTLGNFEGIIVDSIRQEATQTVGIEEISFLISDNIKPFVEKESTDQNSEILIPDWIKSQGKWWVANSISDGEFINAIQFMIKEEIIVIPKEEALNSGEIQTIPDWIRTTVNWWSENNITDQEMANAIQYLIRIGVIRI